MFDRVAGDLGDGKHEIVAPFPGQPGASGVTGHHLTQPGQLHRVVDGVGDGGFAQVGRRRQRVSGHELFRWQVVRIGHARPVEQAGMRSADGISGTGIVGVDADQREIALGQGNRGNGVDVHPQRGPVVVTVRVRGGHDGDRLAVRTGVSDPGPVTAQHPTGMPVELGRVSGL